MIKAQEKFKVGDRIKQGTRKGTVTGFDARNESLVIIRQDGERFTHPWDAALWEKEVEVPHVQVTPPVEVAPVPVSRDAKDFVESEVKKKNKKAS